MGSKFNNKYKEDPLFYYMLADFFLYKKENCSASFSRGVVSKMGPQIENHLDYLRACEKSKLSSLRTTALDRFRKRFKEKVIKFEVN